MAGMHPKRDLAALLDTLDPAAGVVERHLWLIDLTDWLRGDASSVNATVSRLTLFVDALQHFGIGASWGGYESLALAAQPERLREHSAWQRPEPVVRLHIGLEDPADLVADLEQAFEHVHSVRQRAVA